MFYSFEYWSERKNKWIQYFAEYSTRAEAYESMLLYSYENDVSVQIIEIP